MNKFLIIQTAFIGDVILTTPLIEQLYESYSNCQIDVLVRKGNENLLTGHPKINRLYVLDKSQHKYRNVFRMVKILRKTKYQRVINLQRFFTTGLISLFLRAHEKAGFRKNPFSFAYKIKASHEIGNGRHEVARNLDLIRDIVDADLKRPVLYPTHKDYERVKEYIQQPYICIAPTSVWYTKQYPADKWVDFIQNLSSDLNIYLLGGPGDAEACQVIADRVSQKRIFNLAGTFSLKQTAALMKNSRMNYVNDSAPLHLASAMNAPVTAIFCSTVPQFGFYPLSDHSVIVETTEKLDCRPCGLHGYRQCPLGHFNCAHTIQTHQLLK